MLVLSRKPGEKIHIGSGITVTVIEVQGNKIRLGIDAPEEVPIFRAELNAFLGRIGTEPSEGAVFHAPRKPVNPGALGSHQAS